MSDEEVEGMGDPARDEAARAGFGPFEMDLGTLELFRAGKALRLQGQPARLLALLLQRPGELITREEIRRTLWEDETHVDFEQGINQAIRHLRAALGDNAEAPRYLETLPRLGYRFIAPVNLPGATPGAGPMPSLPTPVR
jgi:DNA-binding winged helix-turn-helix (wHTH) protein